MADRLADFWDATVDRTVAGKVTLSKTPIAGLSVTVTVPFDVAKPVMSDAYAAFMLANDIVARLNADTWPLLIQPWNARNQYARFVWKLLAYDDKIAERTAFRATLPGNQRAPVTAEIDALTVKRNRFPTYRDRFRVEAGE